MLTVRLTAPARVTLTPTPEQEGALTAAVSVLKASPAGAIPDIPPGEYRWTSDAIMYTDVEAHASTGRVIMEAAGFGHRALPLPYQANLDTSSFGHEGAENVGRIDMLGPVFAGSVPASGFLTVSEDGEGREYVLAVALGNVPGVSVDAAVLDHTMQYEVDDEGFVVDAVCLAHSWEVMGLTGTPFPAFADARVMVEGVDTADAFADTEEDAPEGEDMPEDMAAAAIVRRAVALGAFDELLTAAAHRAPDASWFDDPHLDRVTPLTVDDDGRVYGHIAPWSQPGEKRCHVGFADRCVCAPKSPDGEYPYFLTGEVACSDGTRRRCGTLALYGGHHPDDGTQPWTQIAAMYDDVANLGALVNVGEDEHGLWAAGCVAPGMGPAEIAQLRACGPSGHWRKVSGDRSRKPRLIAAVAVLSQGFPIESLAASAHDGHLPATASAPQARYTEGDDEPVVLVAATGTIGLAAAHAPATRGDVDALTARLDGMAADLAAAQARLSLLDPGVRAAALDRLG